MTDPTEEAKAKVAAARERIREAPLDEDGNPSCWATAEDGSVLTTLLRADGSWSCYVWDAQSQTTQVLGQ